MPLEPGFRRLFRRADVDRDIEDELAAHLEMKEADLVEEGFSAEAARAEARERLGDTEWVRSECRKIGVGIRRKRQRRDAFDSVAQDVRYAARMTRRAKPCSGRRVPRAASTSSAGVVALTSLHSSASPRERHEATCQRRPPPAV